MGLSVSNILIKGKLKLKSDRSPRFQIGNKHLEIKMLPCMKYSVLFKIEIDSNQMQLTDGPLRLKILQARKVSVVEQNVDAVKSYKNIEK